MLIIKINSNNAIPFNNSVLESALWTRLDSVNSSIDKKGAVAFNLQMGGN